MTIGNSKLVSGPPIATFTMAASARAAVNNHRPHFLQVQRMTILAIIRMPTNTVANGDCVGRGWGEEMATVVEMLEIMAMRERNT